MRSERQLPPLPASVERLLAEERALWPEAPNLGVARARMWRNIERPLESRAPSSESFAARIPAGTGAVAKLSVLSALVGVAIGVVAGLGLRREQAIRFGPAPEAAVPVKSPGLPAVGAATASDAPLLHPAPALKKGLARPTAASHAALPRAVRSVPVPAVVAPGLASPPARSELAPAPAPQTTAPKADSPAEVRSEGGDLARERAMLERATLALRHGDPAEAYALAAEGTDAFPQGKLTEERELVQIKALSALGQDRRAVEHILEFHRRHPQSLLLPAVDSCVPAYR
jgi:hypothetical protein